MDDLPVTHYKHPIGTSGRLKIVRHHDDGSALPIRHGSQYVEDRVPVRRVEGAGGFIGEHDVRTGSDSPGERHALRLAAGQLGWTGMLLPSIPTLSKRSHTSFPLTLRPAKRAGSETFSPTESEGMRLYCWNTNPTCRALTFARSPRLARTTSTPIR